MRTPTGVTIEEYQQAVSEGKPTHVRLTFPVQNIILGDGNITMDGGLTLSTIANPDSDLTMGYSPANVLDVEFFNDPIFVGFDWTEEFKFEAGVEINGTTSWVLIGWFKGTKPEKTLRTKTIQFTAYDMMIKFDRLADDWIDSLTFPMTMQTMFRSLCTYVGVGYASSPVNQISAAMNTTYSENPLFKGVSCRTVLSWIAEANGCYAIYRPETGGTGVIDLRFVNDYTSSMTINEDDCFDFDFEDYTVPEIDYVHIASSDENIPGFVYPLNNTYKYEILDNPLMLLAGTSAKQGMINGIISHFAVMGSYRPMRIVTVGNWLMEMGDMVEVELADGTTYNLIGINKTIQWNGGCVCEYECPGNIERLELNQSKKEKYEIGGKLSDKYTIISGVDITDEGVVVSGSKHIKIYSGGIFLVDSPNFKIDSDNGYLQSGNWQFDDNGLVYNYNANSEFRIINVDDISLYPKMKCGIKTHELNGTYSLSIITPSVFGSPHEFTFVPYYALNGQPAGISFLPPSNLEIDSTLGSNGYRWMIGYINDLYSYNINIQSGGEIKFPSNSPGIKYVGSKATSNLIRFINNTADAYGNGIIIGDGGAVVIGAGESAETVKSGASVTGGTEVLYLASDSNVKIMTNVNNGYANRKEFTFGADGTITAPGRLYQNGNVAVPLQDTNTWRGYQLKQYEYTYTIPANGGVNITASDFNVSTPAGYTPVAIAYYNTADNNVTTYYIDATATGNQTMIALINKANAQISHKMAIKILYLQTGNP